MTAIPPGNGDTPDFRATQEAQAAIKRHFALLVTVTLGVCVLWFVFPFLTGIFGAAIFYSVLVPIHRRLSPRIGERWSAALLTVAMLLLVIGPGVALVTAIAGELPVVLKHTLAGDVVTRLRTVSVGGYALGEHVVQGVGAMLDGAPQRIVGLFAHITLAVLNLAIALLGVYYLLISADLVWQRIRGMLPFSDGHAELLRERFFSVTQAMVVGMVVIALLQGSIVGGGFWIVGLPYPLFWGVVTGFASILPVLGTGLVWGPGVIVLLLQHRYGATAVLLIIGAVLASNIDNVVRPIIYDRVSGLHPMTTLVGAFAGIAFFGLVGVLLGPLAISLFFELVDLYQEEYGDRAVSDTGSGGVP